MHIEVFYRYKPQYVLGGVQEYMERFIITIISPFSQNIATEA